MICVILQVFLSFNLKRRAANGQPKSVWVMGLHLQSDSGLSFFSQPIREAQAKEVDSWMEQGLFHIENNEPVIVAGDLNVPFKMQPQGKWWQQVCFQWCKQLPSVPLNIFSMWTHIFEINKGVREVSEQGPEWSKQIKWAKRYRVSEWSERCERMNVSSNRAAR